MSYILKGNRLFIFPIIGQFDIDRHGFKCFDIRYLDNVYTVDSTCASNSLDRDEIYLFINELSDRKTPKLTPKYQDSIFTDNHDYAYQSRHSDPNNIDFVDRVYKCSNNMLHAIYYVIPLDYVLENINELYNKMDQYSRDNLMGYLKINSIDEVNEDFKFKKIYTRIMNFKISRK